MECTGRGQLAGRMCWTNSDFGPDPERFFPGLGGIMKFPEVLGKIEIEPDAVFIWPGFGTWLPGLWHAHVYQQ